MCKQGSKVLGVIIGAAVWVAIAAAVAVAVVDALAAVSKLLILVIQVR